MSNDTTEAPELRAGEWRATFRANGLLRTLANQDAEFVPRDDARPLIVEVGGDRFALTTPRSLRCGEGMVVTIFDVPGDVAIEVEIRQRLVPLPGNGVAVETTVALSPAAPLGRDVSVRFPTAVTVGDDPEWFAPQKNGVGYVGHGGPVAGQFAWQLGGGVRPYLGGYVSPLGLPLVSLHGDDPRWRLTWCTDPYFSTCFRLGDPQRELNWRYLGAVPMTGTETRTVVACVHEGDERSAMDAFYATALADIPPGPDWLHDIALVHYDYFSKGGEGWFRDVDALAAIIPPDERYRVALCLHGWYDRLGSYSMDPVTRRIRDEWILERSVESMSTSGGLTLSRDRVVEMLRYSRSQGFRTMLYFGDGSMANASWARETFPPPAILRNTGWEEGLSHTVLLSPLHDDVRTWFLDYAHALTAAFGDDADGFVWDETYYFPIGELGPADCPGYADRAFMTLMREITSTVHEHRADLALLGCDCIGVVHTCDGTGHGSVGYSLVADGSWQDSACSPEAWGFGLFPNFRNVMWSCNWWATRNISWTAYGVNEFGTPAATSNGYGEDRGPADYDDAETARLLDLFHHRPPLPWTGFWLSPGDPRTPGPLGTHRLPRAALMNDRADALFFVATPAADPARRL